MNNNNNTKMKNNNKKSKTRISKELTNKSKKPNVSMPKNTKMRTKIFFLRTATTIIICR